MQSIELFSGSGIISEILQQHDFKTFKVDFNPKYKTDMCIDILNLSPEKLPKPVHFFWASPDCTYFSRANHAKDWEKRILKYRQYEYKPLTVPAKNALLLVQKTFEIINYLSPDCWFIENPVGRFRHLDIVRRSVPYRYSINYKDWGFDYSKETDIFTNVMLPLSNSVPLRIGKGIKNIHNKFTRSVVPPRFIHFLINHCFNHSPWDCTQNSNNYANKIIY